MTGDTSSRATLRLTRRIAVTAALLASLGALADAQVRPPVLPSDNDIRAILADRVNALAGGSKDGVGIVVGLIGPEGRRVVAYGQRDKGDARPFDAATVFEIGSVGKLFTALVLADMVDKREVALDDPVAKYLPAGVRIPERHGRAITLADLATHTSGLPFMPDEVPLVSESAAKRYGVRELYQFLARYELTRDPGTEWDYSNVGYWLLGQALASRAGMDFTRLVRTRVLDPLKLESTAFPLPLSPRLKARLAAGHDAMLAPAPSFYSTSVYAALGREAGGLVSTVNDLLTFLSGAMGYERSPLSSSLAAMLATRRPMDGSEQALGWVVDGTGQDQLIVHEGGTWGYASYVAWDPAKRIGAVVLSNQQSGVGDIARHLLRPATPLEHPKSARPVQIAVDSRTLDHYVGRYDADGELFTITRDHAFLMLQLPTGWGLPVFRLRPASRQDFFVSEMPIRVTFEFDAAGSVTGMLVYPPRRQRAIPAIRMSAAK